VKQIAQLDQPPMGALLLSDDPINAGPKLLLAHSAGTRCLLDHAAKIAAIAFGLNAKLASPQRLRQLGDIGSDAPNLVAGEQLGCRVPGAALSRRLGRELPKSAARPNHDRWCNSHHGLAPDGGARRRLKCLGGNLAEEIFVGLVEFGGAVVHEIAPLRLLMLQQFRQLCNAHPRCGGPHRG